jgi:hypothetical protein
MGFPEAAKRKVLWGKKADGALPLFLSFSFLFLEKSLCPKLCFGFSRAEIPR